MRVKKKIVVAACVSLIAIGVTSFGALILSGGKPELQHKRKISQEEIIRQEKFTREKYPENEDEEILSDGISVTGPNVTITDRERTLAAVDDVEEVQVQTKKYLESVDEGRRNLYVDSVTKTENGYRAKLCFDVVRPDMKYILLKFDGDYHFSLRRRK